MLLAVTAVCAMTPDSVSTSSVGMAQPADALIVGRVIDAETGRGLPGSIVTALRPDSAEEGAGLATTNVRGVSPIVDTVAATNDGRFMFYPITPGGLMLTAIAPGYLQGAYGQGRTGGRSLPIQIETGDRRGPLEIRLWRQATLEGRVIDEVGLPLSDVLVRLFRDGDDWPKPFQPVRTNDHGEFRFSSLPPGDYVTAVVPFRATLPTSLIDSYAELSKPGAESARAEFDRHLQFSGLASSPASVGFRVGDSFFPITDARSLITPPPAAAKSAAYTPTYSGGAQTLEVAGRITLSTGEAVRNADIVMKLVPTYRISGSIADESGSKVGHVGVRVTPAGQASPSDLDRMVATGASDANGNFSVFGVPPGDYAIKIQQLPDRPGGNVRSAEVSAVIVDRDIEGVSAVLLAGAAISGRVQFDDSRAKAAWPDYSAIFVIASPAFRGAGRPATASLDAEGRFEIGGLLPGEYRMEIATRSSGVFLKSAMRSGKDVSDLTFQMPSANTDGFSLTITQNRNVVSGTVFDKDGHPDGLAEVWAVPQNALSNPEALRASARRVRVVPVAPDGTYRLSQLPDGDYAVFAIEEIVGGRAAMAKILPKVWNSLSLTSVRGGGEKNQNLVKLVAPAR